MSIDHDIKDVSLSQLMLARELVIKDRKQAKSRFGLDDETINLLLASNYETLAQISDTGILMFTPRNSVVLKKALQGSSGWKEMALQMASLEG